MTDTCKQRGHDTASPRSYEVRKKKKGCVEEMAQLIVDKFTTKPQPGNKRSWRVQVRAQAWGLVVGGD